MKFLFYRNCNEVIRNEYSSFPWEDLMKKEQELEFLMWHVPDDYFTHPETFIEIEKLYSTD